MSKKLPLTHFLHAIQATHGVRSILRERVDVHEQFEGETAWEGEVLVFDLIGHETANTCYAWEVDGRVTTLLSEPPIDSPAKAIRAALAAEGSDET